MAEQHFNTPAEVISAALENGKRKAEQPIGKMILLGMMAGAFIALGGAASSTAAHNMANVGLARLIAGCIFPVGLMMIVLVGGELFTGDCLMVMDVLCGKVSAKDCVRTLCVVYLGNFIGALIIDVLVLRSGNLDYSNGLLGAYTIKVALGKVNISPVKGMASGILCNMLVCTAVLMAGASKDISGKVWAIFFPIMAFVVGGFEHCVANMFYIPAGIMAAADSTYAAMAQEAYGITAEQLSQLTVLGSLKNLIPVTIGNILGGMVFIGIPCWMVQKNTKK